MIKEEVVQARSRRSFVSLPETTPNLSGTEDDVIVAMGLDHRVVVTAASVGSARGRHGIFDRGLEPR